MTLRFDPGNIDYFKEQIRRIPGDPGGEELPIREMVFESGALWRLLDLLSVAGIKPDHQLVAVVEQTPVQREGRDLKDLILKILGEANWPFEVASLQADSTGQVHTD